MMNACCRNVECLVEAGQCICRCLEEKAEQTLIQNVLEISLLVLVVALVIIGLILGFKKLKGEQNGN